MPGSCWEVLRFCDRLKDSCALVKVLRNERGDVADRPLAWGSRGQLDAAEHERAERVADVQRAVGAAADVRLAPPQSRNS